MHVTQVHPVTSENQFHCTGLYAFNLYHAILKNQDFRLIGKIASTCDWQLERGVPAVFQRRQMSHVTRKGARLTCFFKTEILMPPDWYNFENAQQKLFSGGGHRIKQPLAEQNVS